MARKKPMTPEQFEAEMKSIATDYAHDTEGAHGRADDLLCEVLNERGFTKGVQIFEDMPKWYA